MNLVQIALIYGEQLQWQNIEDSFNLNVISNDQAPTDLSLSNNEISENLGTNTLIGTLSTTAPNITNTFNYSLVSGTGSNDNSLFTIIDNQLISNAIFNYEIRNNYSIRIRTTDQNGLFYEEVLEVNILNINEAPTNLNLTLNKNSYHPSETLDIVGNVRDGDGGEDLAKIDLWLQRPNLTWVNLSPIENFENDGDFEQQFSLENYQIGTYQMYARAQDKQGVFSEWVTNTFSVENQAPTNLNLTLNKNSYHPSETLDIVGNVRDGDGGEDLAKIDLWLQRPNLTWVNLSPIENFENDGDFEQQFSLENYQIGTYQMYARAQDKQGMFSEWVTNTFSVENQTTTLESIPSLTALSLTANLETDEVDILTGTSNIDLFELGDTEEVYYSISGIEDYALINNFDVNKDKIQLHGNLEDYYLGTASENLPQGTTIFSNNNELIGIVTGVYELSLHEDYFTFV